MGFFFFDNFISWDWHKAFKQDSVLDLYVFGLIIIQTSKYLDDIHTSTDIKWRKPDQTKHTKTVLEADRLFPSAKHTTCAWLTQSTCPYMALHPDTLLKVSQKHGP